MTIFGSMKIDKITETYVKFMWKTSTMVTNSIFVVIILFKGLLIMSSCCRNRRQNQDVQVTNLISFLCLIHRYIHMTIPWRMIYHYSMAKLHAYIMNLVNS